MVKQIVTVDENYKFPPPLETRIMQAIRDVLYDTGVRNVTSLATGVDQGNVKFRVKNGWARMEFEDVRFSLASPDVFSAGGVLAPWAPSSSDTGRGFVTQSNGGITTRVTASNTGRVALFGAPASIPLNGHVLWAFDRPIPATLLGVAT